MKNTIVAKLILIVLLVVLAVFAPALPKSSVAADERPVPKVDLTFNRMQAGDWSGKMLREIVPPKSLRKIIRSHERGYGSDFNDGSRVACREVVQKDYDDLVAHLFSSKEKATDFWLSAMERITLELVLLSADGGAVFIEVVSDMTGRITAVRVSGAGKGARIPVKGRSLPGAEKDLRPPSAASSGGTWQDVTRLGSKGPKENRTGHESKDAKARSRHDDQSRLETAEKKILAAYQAEFPPKPNGPNKRPTHRLIVTLKPNVAVGRFLIAINGIHETQQWCLMPEKGRRARLGIDTTGHQDPEALILRLRREQSEPVDNVQSGERSEYLQRVLGKCQWRDAASFATFELLAAHVTKGMRRGEVERLLGKPTEDAATADSQRREFWVGLNASAIVVVNYREGRVSDCSLEAEFRGPQPYP
jgi:hypothetical protein